jgi:hypothetical protein
VIDSTVIGAGWILEDSLTKMENIFFDTGRRGLTLFRTLKKKKRFNLRVQLEVGVGINSDSNRSIVKEGLLNHGLVREQIAVAHQVDHCSGVFEGTCALQ